MSAAQSTHLIVPLLRAFIWFDEGLQAQLRSKGWNKVTRPQSMVMAAIAMGLVKPSEIARILGISRQAIHLTINQMIEMDLLELVSDPNDRRAKIVRISKGGQKRRQDARAAMDYLTAELERRIGRQNLLNLTKSLTADWGDPLTDGSEDT
jgi:DNA-binding MarR family transcriptional regulator